MRLMSATQYAPTARPFKIIWHMLLDNVQVKSMTESPTLANQLKYAYRKTVVLIAQKTQRVLKLCRNGVCNLIFTSVAIPSLRRSRGLHEPPA